METIRVEIINPKARKLLNDLADMNLINIQLQDSFSELLSKFRNSEQQAPSLEEITAEVEAVRRK